MKTSAKNASVVETRTRFAPWITSARRTTLSVSVCCLWLVWLAWVATPGKLLAADGPVHSGIGAALSGKQYGRAAEPDKADIEWFKKELKISPKYTEHREGILGLSVAHFLTMVFMTVFAIVALVALVIRHRRTKELVAMLLEEEKK